MGFGDLQLTSSLRTIGVPECISRSLVERPVFTTAAFGLLTYLAYQIIRSIQEYRTDTVFGEKHNCQLPPGLSKKWPLGIDRIRDLWVTNSEGRLLAYLCNIAKDYEPTNMLYQYLLVGPMAYHILNPVNLEAVLSTNFKDYNFGVRPQIFAPLLGKGIFTQEGSAWKHSRELLRKQFARISTRTLDHFREHVENLIARLPHTSGVVDLQPLFFSFTLDTTTSLLMGKSVYSLRAGIDQGEENKLFADSFAIAQAGLAKRFRIAPWHFFYNPKPFREACRNVHRFMENYIDGLKIDKEDIKEEDNSEMGFIKQVVAESESTAEVRDQLLNVLLAGRDTTACCLSWTFRLLVRDIPVLERLKQEISSVMGTEKYSTREQIRRMPYLSCIIKETLRLYPSVPLNNRTAAVTTLLPTGGGPDGTSPILVRKGELVVFSSYVNSRMLSLFGADAYKFRPERWETGEMKDIGWAYFPFNKGPRQCLGEDFALMEVSFTVVRLLQEFEFRLPDGEPVEEVGAEKQELTLVLAPADGCRVEVTRKASR